MVRNQNECSHIDQYDRHICSYNYSSLKLLNIHSVLNKTLKQVKESRAVEHTLTKKSVEYFGVPGTV